MKANRMSSILTVAVISALFASGTSAAQSQYAGGAITNVPSGVKVVPDIAYRDGPSKAWRLDLAMPAESSDTPRPAIVFVHGGGWRSGDKRRENFLRPTLEFAAKGYVCITVNYRLLNETSIAGCVEDVKCAVRWLRAHAKEYGVDPKRIGAHGNSAGAHLVAMLGLCPPSAGLEGDGPWQEHSSIVQAVVASATPTSFLVPMNDRMRKQRTAKSDNQQQRGPRRAADGRSSRSRLADMSEEARRKISPITYVNGDAPPFLLVHEESDRTVGVHQSDSFVKALREAGAKDITYMRYTDGSGHGVFGARIAETGPAREAFFARTLGGGQPQLNRRATGRQRSNRSRTVQLPAGAKLEWDIVYSKVGDRELLLDLCLPAKRSAPVPVIVWIHGGGWRGGSKNSGSRARGMLERGYAVVDVGYRLSGEAIFPAQVEDCKAAVRWVRANASKYSFDPDRIGAWGSSAGGHLVAFLGTAGNVKEFETETNAQYSSRVQAVCDWFGPTDFLQMDKHSLPGSRLIHDAPTSPESLLVGGPIQEEPYTSLARKANPITYVTSDDPPFLIMHGDKDMSVPLHQSELLLDALKKAGVDASLYVVKGGGHGLRGGKETPDELFRMVADFFDKQLKQPKPRAARSRSGARRRPQLRTPTYGDVKYGPHSQNVIDFYKAESDVPTPVAVFIHGGGFHGGSKRSLNAGTLRELLDAGISVAAVEYRFISHAHLPAAHHDSLRALQFIRSKAREWNIDKTRMGAFGGSAGAQICMWLAFHDEMADPSSSDPLKRESSRLTCVATSGGQTTMDFDWWMKWIPGYDKPHRDRAESFGDITDEELRRILEDISALSIVSADDVPIFMSYGMKPDDPVPTDASRAQGWKVHHVMFGVKLKEKMDELGLEADLKYPGARTTYRSNADFFIQKLKHSNNW